MEKRKLSAFPRPMLTEQDRQLPLLVQGMAYLVTVDRCGIAGTDTLVLNFFENADGELVPKFRTFCQADDFISQNLETERTKWSTGAAIYMTGDMYVYRNKGCIMIRSAGERETALEFLQDHTDRSDEALWPYIPSREDVLGALDGYQLGIKARRLKEKHRKELDRIDAQMARFGGVPDDYGRFVERTVFADDNYIFYSLPKRKAYCTKCGHWFRIDSQRHITGIDVPLWNDRDTVTHKGHVLCPYCSTWMECRSEGMGRRMLTAVRWSIMVEKNGRDVLVRYFRHIKDFRNSYTDPEISTQELFRSIHTAEKMEDYMIGTFKNRIPNRWCPYSDTRHGWGEPTEWKYPGKAVVYGNLKAAIKGTCMEYSAADIYLEHVHPLEARDSAWYMDWYFNAYRKAPFIEQLLKVGFYSMTHEYLSGNGLHERELTAGRTILETLGVTRYQFRLLRRMGDPGFRSLDIVKYKPDITWEQYKLVSGRRCWKEFLDMTEYTTLHKAARYVTENVLTQKCSETEYFDYIRWTRKLGYDMKNSFNLYPKDFLEAHDARSEEYKRAKDEMLREAMQRFNEMLRKAREGEGTDIPGLKVKEKGLFIRLPEKIEELNTEGEALHHCVATYKEKVIKGKTMIFFVRRESEPDKPYYTLEWNGHVVQCRGYRNCGMTADVEHLVNRFDETMKASGMELQKHKGGAA